VSSIQERCRLAESLDDLKVMGEAKQGMLEIGTRVCVRGFQAFDTFVASIGS